MKRYKIEISTTAEKQLKRVELQDRIRLLQTIKNLASDPRPSNCRKLRGYEDVYRVRVGYYRIIYEIFDQQILIIVLKVGHRKDIYR